MHHLLRRYTCAYLDTCTHLRCTVVCDDEVVVHVVERNAVRGLARERLREICRAVPAVDGPVITALTALVENQVLYRVGVLCGEGA